MLKYPSGEGGGGGGGAVVSIRWMGIPPPPILIKLSFYVLVSIENGCSLLQNMSIKIIQMD